MIGTNNTSANTAPDIAKGVRKIVQEIHLKTPANRVLLLAVFRAVRAPTDRRRSRRRRREEDGEDQGDQRRHCQAGRRQDDPFLDINKGFLVDGKIPDDIMPIQLHPNVKGYEIWAGQCSRRSKR